jgi:hypothetical protein
MFDTLTRAGAEELALRVRNFWAAHGKAVQVRVEQATSHGYSFWQVRSDLVNAVPRAARYAALGA